MEISTKNYYTIISWNVDEYNDEVHKWLFLFVQKNKPDVIFLSETKKKKEDLLPFFNLFTDYNNVVNSHNPSKWHGVAMLIKREHTYVQTLVDMNIPTRKDSYDTNATTGRVIAIKLNDKINIVGSYTPNSGRTDQVKLDYRTKIWDPAFVNLLETLRNNGPTIWLGDINVALNDIDVSNPKTMKKYAGFTDEERSNLKNLLFGFPSIDGKPNPALRLDGWTDIWRQQNPDIIAYTWLGYPHRIGHGMRLDNIIVSNSLLSDTLNAFVLKGPSSSDHVPIGVYI